MSKVRRADRVGELLREEVSRLVLAEIRDPRVRGVAVTGVDLSDDLRHAKVWWGFVGGADARAGAAEALERAAPFMQREIGRRVELRHTPHLHFVYDEAGDRGRRIDRLVEEARRADAAREAAREGGPPPEAVVGPAGGMILLDKGKGIPSMKVVERLRRAVREKRAGHVGTLDPMATGLLPVLLGKATRLLEYVLAGDKVYEAEVLLGAVTDTDDADGAVLRTADASGVAREAVEAALRAFVGEIVQRPPAYSAIKEGGEPLYERARRGEAVEAPERTVRIEAIDLLSFAPPRLAIRVRCGTGTYIRSLARDLGEALGVGATLSALRRTAVGALRVEDAHALEAIEAAGVSDLRAWILPPERLLPETPVERLAPEEAARVLNGGFVPRPGAPPGPRVQCLAEGELIAVARAVPEPEGGWTIRPVKVLKAEG